MSTGNGNGNHDHDKASALEMIVQGLSEPQTDVQRVPPVLIMRGPVADASEGVGMAERSVLEQVLDQLQALTGEIREVKTTLISYKRDIQVLKDDVRDIGERARLVPAIKDMLKDIILRLPPE